MTKQEQRGSRNRYPHRIRHAAAPEDTTPKPSKKKAKKKAKPKVETVEDVEVVIEEDS